MRADMRRLIVIATLVACSDKSAPPAPAPPAPVVAADAGIEPADLAAARERIAARATRACLRPVVRPPALAGPALADQRALVVACTPEPLTAECGEALHRAVSHSDACSPFQVGADLTDVEFYERFADRVIARQMMLNGWATVELVALAQDLARGHVSARIATLADSIMDTALTNMFESAKLAPLSDEATPAFASLQAAMPHVDETLVAQRDQDLVAGVASPVVACGDTLASCQAGANALASRRARNVSLLAALQVVVASHGKPCPVPPQLAAAPLYKTLLAPPLLGASLRIAGDPTRVAPPAFVTPHVEWNIVCP